MHSNVSVDSPRDVLPVKRPREFSRHGSNFEQFHYSKWHRLEGQNAITAARHANELAGDGEDGESLHFGEPGSRPIFWDTSLKVRFTFAKMESRLTPVQQEQMGGK